MSIRCRGLILNEDTDTRQAQLCRGLTERTQSPGYNENWALDLICAQIDHRLEKIQVLVRKELNLQLIGAVTRLVHAMALFK